MTPTRRAYVCLRCLLQSCKRNAFSTTTRRGSSLHSDHSDATSSAPPSIVFEGAIEPSFLTANVARKVNGDTFRKVPTDLTQEQAAVQRDAISRMTSLLRLEPEQVRVLRTLEALVQGAKGNVKADQPSTETTFLNAWTRAPKPETKLPHSVSVALRSLLKSYGGVNINELSEKMAGVRFIPPNKPVFGDKSQQIILEMIQAGVISSPKPQTVPTSAGTGPTTPQSPSKTKQLKPSSAKRLATGSGTGDVRTPPTGGRRRRPVSIPSGALANAKASLGAKEVKVRTILNSRSDREIDEAHDKSQGRAAKDERIALVRSRLTRSTSGEDRSKVASTIPRLDKDEMQIIRASDLNIAPVEMEVPPVPGLSHDLSRVLFNPGIYQLQDPRSRVYNFDPYLQEIMPISEFDFNSLKEYITSSKDQTLSNIALERGRKYIGSSSSMTSMLTHFHFLLSGWRKINTQTLSRGFMDNLDTFTAINRAPSAVFLKYQEGVYAIDADKEYDSANVLMSLGKSMEKLLTLEKDDFEKYRKSNGQKVPEEEKKAPEAYHYSEMGNFLMRSQLDAYDPRLPGTGMFDLKTRAVLSIRMNVRNVEQGLGYEIKERFGDYESYEREFFDMIRSAFLKYSLQARMGRMDGIFIAFHNIERIFGFQYVSVPELDLHLHGQPDTTLGDQEFKLSLGLLNEVFERVTTKHPEQSIRFHFETRDNKEPSMYIFAEPVDENAIQAIQTAKKEEAELFEKRLMNGPPLSSVRDVSSDEEQSQLTTAESDSEASTTPSEEEKATSSSESEEETAPDPDATAAAEQGIHRGVSFTDSLIGQDMPSALASNRSSLQLDPPPPAPKDLVGMVLTIRNLVNGAYVERPSNLGSSDKWTVQYTLVDMKASEAQKIYRQCKGRRKKELEAVEQTEEKTANFYLRKIKELTEEGIAYRRSVNQEDRKREAGMGGEKVVLYPARR